MLWLKTRKFSEVTGRCSAPGGVVLDNYELDFS